MTDSTSSCNNSLNCLVIKNNFCEINIDAQIKEIFPNAIVSNATSISDAMNLAEKYVGHHSHPVLIVCEIQCNHAADKRMAEPQADDDFAFSARVNFTDRQRQLIDLLMIGKSNKAIADLLDLSYGTVKNYVFDLMRLMSVGSRLELVARVRTDPHVRHHFSVASHSVPYGKQD